MTRYKKVKTALAEPGMIVGKDIYSVSGHLIINAGTELTDHVITRLQFYSIPELYIAIPDKKPEVAAKTATRPASQYLTHVEQVKASDEFKQFSKSFYSTFVSFREHLNQVVRGEAKLDTGLLLETVTEIFASCKNPNSLFDMMLCIRSLDDVTYVHNMNVALVCKMFANWLKFSEQETNNLILAGLLHDIGKMLIPKSILTKPTKLTDEEFQTVKNHAQLGYSILKNQNIDPHICLAALQHHERCDGSGYPLGLTATQMDSYAKIVAIADVYDALTASRVYRGPICPLEAIGIFQTEGLTKYDPKYLMVFLDGIMNAYLNCTVRLSNGQTGRIIMMQRNSLDRPVVYISENNFIDLAKNPNITVAEII